MKQQARLEIVVEGHKFSKIVIFTEGAYDDESIQEEEVLEAFREVRRTMKNSSFWKKNLATPSVPNRQQRRRSSDQV